MTATGLSLRAAVAGQRRHVETLELGRQRPGRAGFELGIQGQHDELLPLQGTHLVTRTWCAPSTRAAASDETREKKPGRRALGNLEVAAVPLCGPCSGRSWPNEHLHDRFDRLDRPEHGGEANRRVECGGKILAWPAVIGAERDRRGRWVEGEVLVGRDIVVVGCEGGALSSEEMGRDEERRVGRGVELGG